MSEPGDARKIMQGCDLTADCHATEHASDCWWGTTLAKREELRADISPGEISLLRLTLHMNGACDWVPTQTGRDRLLDALIDGILRAGWRPTPNQQVGG